MRVPIYYVLVPTDELLKAATETEQVWDWLVGTEVWSDTSDGPQQGHFLEEVKKAAWTVFLAKLAGDEEGTEGQRRFMQRCLQLGFDGCWRIYVGAGGDPIEDLLDEAKMFEAAARRMLGG